MRIISVVPSLTELLFDLGLENQIVGITRFCIHPKKKTKSVQKIGGTKKLHIERIIELKPDLIIANKEENEKTDIEKLQKLFPVYLTDIYTLEDSLQVILNIGNKTKSKDKATELVNRIRSNFNNIILPESLKKQSVAYVIWQKPTMLAGTNTFINDLLLQMGMTNIIVKPSSRYPVVTDDELKHLQPNFIFLSSEPFPFKEKEKKLFQNTFVKSQVILVDGEMFSWYGSRLLHAPKYFQNLINEII